MSAYPDDPQREVCGDIVNLHFSDPSGEFYEVRHCASPDEDHGGHYWGPTTFWYCPGYMAWPDFLTDPPMKEILL